MTVSRARCVAHVAVLVVMAVLACAAIVVHNPHPDFASQDLLLTCAIALLFLLALVSETRQPHAGVFGSAGLVAMPLTLGALLITPELVLTARFVALLPLFATRSWTATRTANYAALAVGQVAVVCLTAESLDGVTSPRMSAALVCAVVLATVAFTAVLMRLPTSGAALAHDRRPKLAQILDLAGTSASGCVLGVVGHYAVLFSVETIIGLLVLMAAAAWSRDRRVALIHRESLILRLHDVLGDPLATEDHIMGCVAETACGLVGADRATLDTAPDAPPIRSYVVRHPVPLDPHGFAGGERGAIVVPLRADDERVAVLRVAWLRGTPGAARGAQIAVLAVLASATATAWRTLPNPADPPRRDGRGHATAVPTQRNHTVSPAAAVTGSSVGARR